MNNQPISARSTEAPPNDFSYSLSSRDALPLFVDAGQEISLRTFQRYCQNGILDCTKSETEIDFEWLATRASVETRIEHMKKIAKSRPVATERDKSRPGASEHDDDATGRDDGAGKSAEIETKVRDLEIATQVKDQYIKQLESDRSQLLDRIEKTSHALGAAEMQVRSLQAGRSNDQDDEGET